MALVGHHCEFGGGPCRAISVPTSSDMILGLEEADLVERFGEGRRLSTMGGIRAFGNHPLSRMQHVKHVGHTFISQFQKARLCLSKVVHRHHQTLPT